MYYYRHGETVFASLLPDLPLEPAERPAAGSPGLFLIDRDPVAGRSSFCVSDPRQLAARAEDVSWLDPARMGVRCPACPGGSSAPSTPACCGPSTSATPAGRSSSPRPPAAAGERRVNLLAVGDVGSTLLTALKLLGGDCIERIGICDLNEKAVSRWVAELGQVSWPWDYDALPEVEPVAAGGPVPLRRVPLRRHPGRAPGGRRRPGRADGPVRRQPPPGGAVCPPGPAGGIPGPLHRAVGPGGPPVQGGVSGLQPGGGRPVGRAGPPGRADPGLRPGRDERPGGLLLQAGSPVPQLPHRRPQLRPPRPGAGDRQLPHPLRRRPVPGADGPGDPPPTCGSGSWDSSPMWPPPSPPAPCSCC